MESVEALGPLDGRYRRQVEPLAEIFSEKGLHKYRIMIEAEYLIKLSEHANVRLRDFSKKEKRLIRNLENITIDDAKLIKQIETKGFEDIKATNHDVKAVEYYMKHRLKHTSLNDVIESIHFALTSEDINNLAYATMLSDSMEQIILPALTGLQNSLDVLAKTYANLPMLARTHGQAASSTTFGKEFAVFANRLDRQILQLRRYRILAKLNGASGNYCAHVAAYPDVDWPQFTVDLIGDLSKTRLIKLEPNLVTTQIEPHDTYAELFDNLKRINTILTDFDQDMWRYISDEWIKQKPVEGEVGSSAMPHKVNPIDFENSEGNLGLANALLEYCSRKLPISRLQRDLSDSTVERNFGVILGHCLVAYNSIQKGLRKIAVNGEYVMQYLNSHPEVISEGIQTILRREGSEMPYEKLKQLTRGRKVTRDDFRQFIESLEVTPSVKQELQAILPETYIGLAPKLSTEYRPLRFVII